MPSESITEPYGPIKLAPGCCGLLQLCRPGHVAINRITCKPEYVARFQELFSSRAHAIDSMPGFLGMYVLQPTKSDEPYLVISHWVNEEAFREWTNSEAFIEGHKRAFADLKAAKERGEEPPMTSDFRTYTVLTL